MRRGAVRFASQRGDHDRPRGELVEQRARLAIRAEDISAVEGLSTWPAVRLESPAQVVRNGTPVGQPRIGEEIDLTEDAGDELRLAATIWKLISAGSLDPFRAATKCL